MLILIEVETILSRMVTCGDRRLLKNLFSNERMCLEKYIFENSLLFQLEENKIRAGTVRACASL